MPDCFSYYDQIKINKNFRTCLTVVFSFDHSSHTRKTQVKIRRHDWGQKADGHYKIQSCTQKTAEMSLYCVT